MFAATEEGVGMTSVIISFHKNITDYHRKWDWMRLDWKGFVEDIQSFIVSLEEEIKRFSLTHLKDVPLYLSLSAQCKGLPMPPKPHACE